MKNDGQNPTVKALTTVLAMAALGLLLFANSITAGDPLKVVDLILGSFFLLGATWEALFNREDF